MVKFSLIGYQPFSLTVLAGLLKFQKYNLTKVVSFLEIVTVTLQKNLIEKTLKSFIENAAVNIIAIVGTGTAILINTPTISVD